MKTLLLAFAAAATVSLGGCINVRVDETTVFAPVPFDEARAKETGEKIDGERGFAAADAWTAAWTSRVERGVLTAPAPGFVATNVEHGRVAGPGGFAWTMLSRAGEGRPLIVRCGGNASTRQRNGFVYGVTALPHGDVLEFDYPGSGETGGAASPEAFEAMRDGLLRLVREKAAGRELVLWGHSLGGFVCSQLAERMPETDGVIIETSARNAKEVSKAWTPWFAGPFVKITIAEGIAAYDNAISLKGFKGPVLVLGALHDQTLPVQLARSLGKALTEEGVDAVYLEFKEGGHSSLPGQTGFAPAIDAFFARVK